MARRHKIALEIQKGACNMIPITNELVKAIAEVREEGGVYEEDAAVRLIVHQMAHLCGIERMNRASFPDYDNCEAICKKESATAATVS